MKYLIFLGLVAAAILSRFVPHMPNVAPITAIAIFAGAYLPKKYAFAMPLAVRFISDIFIGFFSWPLMLAVYGAHLLGVVFGIWIKKTSGSTNHFSKSWQKRWLKIGESSLVASFLFFVITNFAFLYSNYPHTWAGIVLSYVNGLPFLRGTVIGDVGYTVILFGGYELALFVSRYVSRHVAQKLSSQFSTVGSVVNSEN